MSETFDPFAHPAAHFNPDCPVGCGSGAFKYDLNHTAICPICCGHDKGWRQLTEAHGADRAGRWCCGAGCGHIVDGEGLILENKPLELTT